MDLDNEGNLLCPYCKFNYVHPHDVVCRTAQDGDQPTYYLQVKQCVDDNGKFNLLAIQGIKPIDGFDTWNRVRELDTFLTFTCESCHLVFGLQFLLHKGMTNFKCLKLPYKIDELKPDKIININP